MVETHPVIFLHLLQDVMGYLQQSSLFIATQVPSPTGEPLCILRDHSPITSKERSASAPKKLLWESARLQRSHIRAESSCQELVDVIQPQRHRAPSLFGSVPSEAMERDHPTTDAPSVAVPDRDMTSPLSSRAKGLGLQLPMMDDVKKVARPWPRGRKRKESVEAPRRLHCLGYLPPSEWSLFLSCSIPLPGPDAARGSCLLADRETGELFLVDTRTLSSRTSLRPFQTCMDATRPPGREAFQQKVQMLPGSFGTLDEHRRLVCVSYYGSSMDGARHWDAGPKRWDCGLTVALPQLDGICEYVDPSTGVLYTLSLSSLGARWHPTSCASLLRELKQQGERRHGAGERRRGKYHMVYTFQEAKSLLQSNPSLQCVARRRTQGCDPDGPLISFYGYDTASFSCDQEVNKLESGFCEFQDRETGEYYGLLPMGCFEVSAFKCSQLRRLFDLADAIETLAHGNNSSSGTEEERDAASLTKEPIQKGEKEREAVSPASLSFLKKVRRGGGNGTADREEFEDASSSLLLPTELLPARRGIVICLNPKDFLNAKALLATLKRLGTSLPIEIWATAEEEEEMRGIQSSLQQLYPLPLSFRFASASLSSLYRGGANAWNKQEFRYMIKVYALLWTHFDQVLVLDDDNIPIRDPSYLFDSMAFKEHGSVFWPDFWHNENVHFLRLDSASYVWDLLGVRARRGEGDEGKKTMMMDMHEVESGQLLVDKRRAKKALEVLSLLLEENDLINYFTWGDKEMFRFAWAAAGEGHFMIPYKAAVGGYLRADGQGFCGQTMVQHDPEGRVIFLHRNAAKLKREDGRQLIWQYVQEYNGPGRGRVDFKDDCYYYEDSTDLVPFSKIGASISDLEEYLLTEVAADTQRAVEMKQRQWAQHALPREEERRVQYESHRRLLERGRALMREKVAVFGLYLPSRSTHSLRSVKPFVQTAANVFKDFYVVLSMEAGIAKATVELAASWKSDDPQHVFYFQNMTGEEQQVPPLHSGEERKKKGEHLGGGNRANNRAREEEEREENFLRSLHSLSADFAILIDPRALPYGWTTDGLFSSFGYLARAREEEETEENLGRRGEKEPGQHEEKEEEDRKDWAVLCSHPTRWDGLRDQSLAYKVLKRPIHDLLEQPYEVDSCLANGVRIYDLSRVGECLLSTSSSIEGQQERDNRREEDIFPVFSSSSSPPHLCSSSVDEPVAAVPPVDEQESFHSCLRSKHLRIGVNPAQVARQARDG